MEQQKQLTLGSLFSGSGGFELAGKLCGMEPLWASEIEPFPIRVTTKRLPKVQHLGDIRAIDGAKIPPVDIITMGSPCTNLSLAGRREGLMGKESSLFFEAIRIIKEMRKETKNAQPRYIIWENVAGAMSSGKPKGEDFRTVLSEIAGVAEPGAEVPACPKNGWPYADVIVGDGWSVAYRLIDAQHFGVPQRRKRIYLVADFKSERAGDLLFEREGVRRDFAQGFRTWESAAGTAAGGADPAIAFEPGALKRLGRNISLELSPTLRASVSDNSPPAVALENHPADSRLKISKDGKVQTLSSRMGTGGNNTPLVFGISSFDSHAMKSHNPHAGIYEANTARTLDANGGYPACNQGGIAVVCGIGRVAAEAYCLEGDSAPAAKQQTYAMTAGCYAQVYEEQSPCLQARDYKDPNLLNQDYIIRRLMPQECALLQGFPSWWCAGLETKNPTEEDITFWAEVWETHRRAVGKSKKPKSRNQIVKWLQNPHSDSAEYKMWGNGCALPCILFVLQGIVEAEDTG